MTENLNVSASGLLPARRRKPRAGFVYALPWIAPGFIVFFAFMLLPMILQLLLGFTRSSFGLSVDRLTLDNYIELATDRKFLGALQNNIKFAIATVTGKIVFGFALAAAMNAVFVGRSLFRTIFFLPVIVSFVATGVIWGFMLQFRAGGVNGALAVLGLGDFAPDWLGNPNLALWSVAFVDIWKWTGFHMVIFLAGLQSLPRDLYEAAELDGANRFEQFRSITIPLMRPYIITNVIIATLGAFSVFDLVFIMTSGGPFGASEVVMTQIYLQAFQFQRFGYASAQASILMVIVVIVSVSLLALNRRAQNT